MKGYIKITDKVYFKPDGLSKPKRKDFVYSGTQIDYEIAIDEYEASKKTVEVSNKINSITKKESTWLWVLEIPEHEFMWKKIINNQPCEAKIENNKAIIIKLN